MYTVSYCLQVARPCGCHDVRVMFFNWVKYNLCMLNHWLEWDKWVLTNIDHDRQWFNTLIPLSDGSSEMWKLITLPTLPVPEIDLSLILELLKFSERYGHRGSDEPASVNIIDWLIDWLIESAAATVDWWLYFTLECSREVSTTLYHGRHPL